MSSNAITKPAAAPTADPFEGLRVSFDPVHLPRLAIFMPRWDIRYYLNGVRVERAPQGGVFLVATDGHTLLAIHDRTGEFEWPGHDGEGIIVQVSAGAIAAAKKATSAAGRREFNGARVLVKGQRLSVSQDLGEAPHAGELCVQAGKCQIEGNFPAWRKVLPDFATLEQGSGATGAEPGGLEYSGVNSHYLARLSRVSPRSAGQWGGVVLWHSKKKPGLTLAQFLDVPEMVALIMGMRGDNGGLRALPNFGQAEPAKQAANDPAGADGREAALAA